MSTLRKRTLLDCLNLVYSAVIGDGLGSKPQADWVCRSYH
ncbi:uncharacterized protein METZ01_LOCUS395474 [marine metagenome]|uniref:ADP-ribosylglycohydrolase n=1 Tax=marine metagenome TaxID=408172 RepID=A0A382V838_9ZZZZ